MTTIEMAYQFGVADSIEIIERLVRAIGSEGFDAEIDESLAGFLGSGSEREQNRNCRSDANCC